MPRDTITEAEKYEGLHLHSEVARAEQALGIAKERLALFNLRLDRKYRLGTEDGIYLVERKIVRADAAPAPTLEPAE